MSNGRTVDLEEVERRGRGHRRVHISVHFDEQGEFIGVSDTNGDVPDNPRANLKDDPGYVVRNAKSFHLLLLEPLTPGEADPWCFHNDNTCDIHCV
jgi:hypothetical protein